MFTPNEMFGFPAKPSRPNDPCALQMLAFDGLRAGRVGLLPICRHCIVNRIPIRLRVRGSTSRALATALRHV